MCDHAETIVINSRIVDGYRYRRRKCRACGERFSTYEVPVDLTGEGPVKSLRDKFGFPARLQEAIGELIDAALEPEVD